MRKTPPYRKLRGYAFDPSLSLKIDTAAINDIVYKIPWEQLDPGPCGEYLEVIDYDPTVDAFYIPVNLNDEYILAQDGFDPSESNPQFHQQMVYAVAMRTIKNFEKALGRKILWASHRVPTREYEQYVPKLRIYPHALREANAYYSPVHKALLFGYFTASPTNKTLHMPGSLVFTCLSQDIIAHETTHAILDGMHAHFNEPTNPDMLAFHEAFADIVALFQHFTFPEVLRHQIARTRGDLTSQNLLGQLAQEFGSAIGNYGSLRDAIGSADTETGQWKPAIPNPDDYLDIDEPHARGSILVSAVFEAFISIYKTRTADLIRIASEGTGILRLGELHPDLVNRLATEASRAADHVLRMCIRALDYCPPVDLTFGDFLRAIITADADLVADDERDYRLAFIDAFRRRGIYPEGIRTLGVESLRFPALNIKYATDVNSNVIGARGSNDNYNDETLHLLGSVNGFLREYADQMKYVIDRDEIYNLTKIYIRGDYRDRNDVLVGLHRRINLKFNGSVDFSKITGLAFVEKFDKIGIGFAAVSSGPSFQIQNLRLVSRVGPDGNQINQVIFSLIQRSGVIVGNGRVIRFLDPEVYNEVKDNEEYFEFKGGCTMIFDLDNLQLKYAISKPIIERELLGGNLPPRINASRLQRQIEYLQNGLHMRNEFARYFAPDHTGLAEPFAFLHHH